MATCPAALFLVHAHEPLLNRSNAPWMYLIKQLVTSLDTSFVVTRDAPDNPEPSEILPDKRSRRIIEVR